MMSSLPSLMEVRGPVANDLGVWGSSVIRPTLEWKEEERTRGGKDEGRNVDKWTTLLLYQNDEIAFETKAI